MKFNKFKLFIISVALLSAVILATRLNSKKLIKPENLILISIDTLRPDHMGVYGYSKNTTPNIDKWAKDATVFTKAYTIIPFTYPSFAALMTGQHGFKTGIVTNGLSPRINNNTDTIAKILKNQGFKTSAFVTNRFIGSVFSGLDRGFDEYHEFDAFGYWKKDREKYIEFIDQAVKWIYDNKNKKVFLWIHLMDPHHPYYPTVDTVCNNSPKYCAEMQGKQIDQIDNQILKYFGCKPGIIPKEKLNFAEALYDGDIMEADLLAGRIFEALEKTGLGKKSLTVLYGDHGEGFDHNYYFTHGDVLYNSSLKIPLVIKYPDNSEGKKNESIIDNTDIFFLIRDSFQKDRRPAEDKKKAIYSSNRTLTKFSITTDRYKYIYSLPDSCGDKKLNEELYDLWNDPSEKNNLISERKETARELKSRLIQYLSEFNLPQDQELNTIRDEEMLEKLKSLGY